MELYVKDFGAKGDGVTDDGIAIQKAVTALRNSLPGSVLHFEEGKTYYYKDNGVASNAVFDFKHNTGLTVKGHNCLIKLGGYDNIYMNINGCTDMVMENINFDYAEYKAAFAATVESFDEDEVTAIMTADRPINLETGEIFDNTCNDFYLNFGTCPAPSSRYYMLLEKYEMLDAHARKVKVYFKRQKSSDGKWNASAPQCVIKVLGTNLYKEYGLVMPMPRSAFTRKHTVAVAIINNTNVTLRNINLYSAMYCGSAIASNKGTLLFENVNLMRAPYDQNLKFTSWGDNWHCYNNRAKFIWKNCKSEWQYDDAINMHAVTLFVEEKHSDKEITLAALDPATGYYLPEVWPGDTITIIDKDTGAMIGRPSITQVLKQGDNKARVVLSEALSDVKAGRNCCAWDENTVCDPASEMIDCDMDGTFRVRANMTFNGCSFYVRRFWIGLECFVEGPLPRDILFKDCILDGDDGDEKDGGRIWEVRSYNDEEGGYHAENIVFENCNGICMDKVRKDPNDQVIIR